MPENSQALLDPEETSVSDPTPTVYQTYLTRKNPQEWSATYNLYSDLKFQGESDHVQRFLNCRTTSFFVRHNQTGRVHVHTNACRLRWCPLCANAKAKYQKMAVLDWCNTRRNLKLLTLTLKHSPAPLEHQLTHLYRCFTAFRKDRIIRNTIRGAIWFTQIKLAKSDSLWHPHVHLIIDSDFIPQATLVAIWNRITKTSKIVDIRAIKTPRIAVAYVGRYAARPAQLAVLTPGKRAELALALRSKRLAGTWGTAREIKLTAPPITDKHHWQPLGTWETIINTKATNDESRRIFEAWQTGNIYTGLPVEPELQRIWTRAHILDEPEPLATYP
ncbi:hypothetical protein ES703_56540 [subsurface metagenome]